MKTVFIFCFILTLTFFSCENRSINEGEKFQPREIHEDIVFHFDKIEVDGIEYLILEKDNNNPHEGFGFMAFRANKLMEKQDTVLAYLRTLNELNVQLLAAISKKPTEEVRLAADVIFQGFLAEEREELQLLESREFSNRQDSVNHLPK